MKLKIFNPSLFFIAFRCLLGKGNKGSRYLLGAALGIAVSFIPIMVTLIVADGMIRGITDRFLELGTGHLQVWPRFSGKEEAIDTAYEKISEKKGVRGVWHETQGLGIILSTAGKTGTTIRAVDPSFWQEENSKKYLTVKSGAGIIEKDNEVLLGEELAKTVGAEVGKTLRIMTVRTGEGGKSIPRTTVFTVKGIVSSGYHELDSMWCITTFDSGRRILGSGAYRYLVVKVDDPYRGASEAAYSISWELGNGFAVYTWKQLQRAQYSSYESTRQMLLFIMALIVLVAAVNVSSATSMLVLERQRDIAVLKSFGTSPGETKFIFIAAGLLTGLTGTIIGIFAGLVIGCNINQIISALENFINLFAQVSHGDKIKILNPDFYLEKIPIMVDYRTVIFIGLFAVLCSIVSSAFPAARAGKTKPVELLQKF
ncbi:ABC transporter substrate-binding protein [Spirochaetia bacterium]|nr:ABC transporter substrate-binding protein [Spirochaetia bacterium]